MFVLKDKAVLIWNIRELMYIIGNLLNNKTCHSIPRTALQPAGNPRSPTLSASKLFQSHSVSPVQMFAFRFSFRKSSGGLCSESFLVSHPYVRTVRVKVLYNRILTQLRIKRLFVLSVTSYGHAENLVKKILGHFKCSWKWETLPDTANTHRIYGFLNSYEVLTCHKHVAQSEKHQ